MVRKPNQVAQDDDCVLLKPREALEAELVERVAQGRELLARTITSVQDLATVKADHRVWDVYNGEMLKRSATTDYLYRRYSSPFAMASSGYLALPGQIEEFHEDIESEIVRLRSIIEILPLIDEDPGLSATSPDETKAAPVHDGAVFVVHGHDMAARESVARLIQRLGLQADILHEQPDGGRTIIEKLEQVAQKASFAVVLLTPDDIGGCDAEHLLPRARQNVILELGYFAGKLGRERVRALHAGDVEIPSDFSGVLYIPMDNDGSWQYKLAREMRSAGMPVDLNKLG